MYLLRNSAKHGSPPLPHVLSLLVRDMNEWEFLQAKQNTSFTPLSSLNQGEMENYSEVMNVNSGMWY